MRAATASSGLIWIPLTVALLLFPSLKFDVAIVDGGTVPFYGTPLPWNSRSLAFSMAKDIYVVPLAIDVAFYVIVSMIAVRLWGRHVPTTAGLNRAAGAAVWVWGTASALYFGLLAAQDLSLSLWYGLEMIEVRDISPSLAF